MYQYLSDLADEQAAEDFQKEQESVTNEEIDYVQISYDVYESLSPFGRNK